MNTKQNQALSSDSLVISYNPAEYLCILGADAWIWENRSNNNPLAANLLPMALKAKEIWP